MKVSGDWLKRPETQAVFQALGDAYAVGGCVRNALLGEPVADVDLSTPLVPDEVIRRAEAAGMKAVPTGIEHGTITVVSGGIPHEVTTYRRDVETDGRHAVVAFADTMEEDAKRRDFTMNALYADASGHVVDPVGGLEDLRARHFRFIGDADARIQEDALRILRLFRFHAQYGRGEMNADALAAVERHVGMLEKLSLERITQEVRKLLEAPDPLGALRAMEQCGAMSVLPGADLKLLPHVLAAEFTPDWITRLLGLGAERFRLRLSKAETTEIGAAETALSKAMDTRERGYRFGAAAAFRAAVLEAAILQRAPDPETERVAEEGAGLVFPVKAADLCPPMEPGPELGKALRELEERWIRSGFEMSNSQLIER